MSDPFLTDANQPALIVTGGPLDGALLSFEPSIEKVLGSSASCHLKLDGSNVSFHHAEVLWDAAGLVLRDVGSEAGTYVNGEKVTTPRALQDGDRICLGPPGSKGSVKLVVRLPAGAVGGPAPLVLDEPDVIFLDVDQAAPAGAVGSRDGSAKSAPGAAGALAPPAQTPASPPAAAAGPAASGTSAAAPASVSTIPPPRPPPAPAAASPAAARAPEKRPRPDFSELPSIGVERKGEPMELPPVLETALKTKVVRPARRAMPSWREVPRPVLLGVATAAVVGGGLLGYLWLRAPPPVLTAVSPAKAEPGQPVTLAGKGFDSAPDRNTVRFGDQTAQVTSAAPETLAAIVPAGLSATHTEVTVETRGGRSNAFSVSVVRRPRVVGLEPDVALPGAEIVVRGVNLDAKQVRVLVGGLAAEIRGTQPGALRITVPDLPVIEGRAVALQVEAGTETSPPIQLTLGRLPLVLAVEPTSGQAGDRLTLKGRGFDPNPAGNKVSLGGQRALVLSASAAQLTVSVPGGVGAGGQLSLPVRVEAGGRTSATSTSFTVLRPSTATYVPRFFAAPEPEHAGHDHALVGIDPSPVLLLTGKGDATSTAERAARVAASLNALVDTATSGSPVKLEVREQHGHPAVAVSGKPDVLVSATPEDVAGYGEAWEGSVRSARLTARSVATYWAALLQDLLALFIARERPVHVLELSPRGKVLLDIYSDAARRVGPGNGVPTSLMNPLPSALARGLRDAALLLPAPGQAMAAAAVTGRWEGTMEEAGQGARSIEIRLRLVGSKLDGSLAARTGKVSMELPLREVSYDKGVLKFVVTRGGAPRHFTGTVDGTAINGTIHGGDRAQELGRFSLRYAQ